jgi:hypothetical protein
MPPTEIRKNGVGVNFPWDTGKAVTVAERKIHSDPIFPKTAALAKEESWTCD